MTKITKNLKKLAKELISPDHNGFKVGDIVLVDSDLSGNKLHFPSSIHAVIDHSDGNNYGITYIDSTGRLRKHSWFPAKSLTLVKRLSLKAAKPLQPEINKPMSAVQEIDILKTILGIQD